jgi:uncharacterized membrane protein YkoI
MIISSKECACFLAASALSLGIFAVTPAAQAGSIVTDPPAIAQASAIKKAQAEAIALNAVKDGGTVVLAVLEKEDGKIHWSIDIVGKTAEYEVWVSTSGKVLKIITEPL